MHVLFVHPTVPSPFCPLAEHLATAQGWRCTFVSEDAPAGAGPVERIRCRPRGAASLSSHVSSRPFENAVWHGQAVYQALKARPDVRPDLIVGLAGLGSTVFLRELHDCPILNHVDHFHRPVRPDADFRPDFPPSERERLRARARNAMTLLELENCDAGYTSTRWQHACLPASLRDKVRVVAEGIDTAFWRPRPGTPRRLGGQTFPAGVRLVTFANRGLESSRGFDVFVKLAGKLGQRRRDVMFLVAGEDRVCFGDDGQSTEGKPLKEWLLLRSQYDPSRVLFLGVLPPEGLARLFSLSDLHVHLSAPSLPAWPLVNALACGATVLGSDTPPVREVIEHGYNGLLADFFDADGMAERADRVLASPAEFAPLGRAAVEMVGARHSLEACLPGTLQLYREVARMAAPSTIAAQLSLLPELAELGSTNDCQHS